MAKQKFTAPQGNPYSSIIQSTEQQQPKPAARTEYYRFNAKFPIEYKEFLQEMAWRNRLTINDYLVKIVGEYMEARPDWKETINITNI